ERHAHTPQRVAGDDAVGHRLDDALLHRRDETGGDHAALDRIDELKALAVRQRLDLDVTVAELAAAAGLLLVAAVCLGLAPDRLAVREARRLEVDLHAVALLHALDDHLDVDLRQAGDDLLPGLVVAVEVDRRVFLLEAAQRLADLLLVALGLRLD